MAAQGRLTLLVGALLALLLLVGAVPRLGVSLLLLAGDDVLADMRAGRPVTAADLETLIAGRKRAAAFGHAGRVWTDLALARLELATTPDVPAYAASLLIGQAIGDLRAGLALAPASPHAWARLAWATLDNGGDTRSIEALLEMARLTGPNEPDIIPVHADLIRALALRQARRSDTVPVSLPAARPPESGLMLPLH